MTMSWHLLLPRYVVSIVCLMLINVDNAHYLTLKCRNDVNPVCSNSVKLCGEWA
jgi:hypothetical protein